MFWIHSLFFLFTKFIIMFLVNYLYFRLFLYHYIKFAYLYPNRFPNRYPSWLLWPGPGLSQQFGRWLESFAVDCKICRCWLFKLPGYPRLCIVLVIQRVCQSLFMNSPYQVLAGLFSVVAHCRHEGKLWVVSRTDSPSNTSSHPLSRT